MTAALSPTFTRRRRPAIVVRSRRAVVVTWAFVRMGARATFSYPLSFILMQASVVLSVIAYVFLGRLIHSSAAVGPDYLSFAAIGLAAAQLCAAGVLGLGQELDWAIEQGRLEMLLIEPVSWRLIPLALGTWPCIYRAFMAGVILLASLGLGAQFVPGQIPAVLALSVLAVLTGLAIGVTAGAIRVLAKRGDPIASIYMMLAMVFTGQFVPLNVFPLPLRVLAWFFPNTYVIAGMRKALMPHASGIYGPDTGQAILLLLAFCAVLLPLGLWIFGRSLELGRRYGMLAGY
ncbi:MAG: ABC transporter permease [Acidimicrobiales bacterium]